MKDPHSSLKTDHVYPIDGAIDVCALAEPHIMMQAVTAVMRCFRVATATPTVGALESMVSRANTPGDRIQYRT